MTPKQLQAMTDGQLETLVLDKVLQWQQKQMAGTEGKHRIYWYSSDIQPEYLVREFFPATRWEHAMVVVEHMRNNHWSLSLSNEHATNSWDAEFFPSPDSYWDDPDSRLDWTEPPQPVVVRFQETGQRAILIAALLAVQSTNSPILPDKPV